MLALKGTHGVIILENVTFHSTYLRTVFSENYFEPKRERERVKGECEMAY
jgi:hypothetical protein